MVFLLGDCVNRFVSSLNSGPHVSGLSRRQVSEHVRAICKNSEERETTCADAHVSRRFKPWIVRSCATKLASIQCRDHGRADHHSLRCLWKRVHAVSRVFFFVLDVCMGFRQGDWVVPMCVSIFCFKQRIIGTDVHAMRVYAQELKRQQPFVKLDGICPLCEDVCHQVGFGPESGRRSFRPNWCCITLKVARLPRPASFLFGSV